jgi:short-subunit dehydrogenase
MELAGRHVLVTGASRGIGRGLAEGFAAAGARVALVARREAPLKELAARLGGTAHAADLTDPVATVTLARRVEDEAGPVDILVNNAGVSHIGYFLSQSGEQIEQIYQVNLLAPVRLCRELLPRMIERGSGHVVNVSSLAAVISTPGLVHYGSSKAGLSHYTAGLRQELRGLPIGVTLVELGSVPTELDDQTRDWEPMRAFLERQRRGKKPARDDRVPLDTVVRAVVDAVRKNEPHVRLPRALAPLAMLSESPRRLSRWLFRSVDARGPEAS